MKIVINKDYGGFEVSEEVLAALGREECEDDCVELRTCVKLVALVEAKDLRLSRDLCVVEIPDDVKWQIEEYDGKEWVAEKHRVWHGR